MPKDEVDPEDPLELVGVTLASDEETNGAMAECFIEEFMRLGYGGTQILSLFKNRHYTGPYLVFAERGEDFIREKIDEVFGWWRRPSGLASPSASPPVEPEADSSKTHLPMPAQSLEWEAGVSDPGGAGIPKINL